MKLSKTSRLTFSLWLPLALTSLLLAALAYGAVQQNYRLNANDPQVQMTSEIPLQLKDVEDISQLAGSLGQTEIDKTINPFFVIYDENNKPLVGNGYLDNQLPTPPAGAFATAKKRGSNTFTWQPRKDLRFAASLKPFEGKQKGFVLAARDLKPTDEKIMQLNIFAGVGLLATWLASFAACWFAAKHLSKHFASHDHSHEAHHAG